MPRKPPEKIRTELLQIRFRSDELGLIKRVAEEVGLDASSYMRSRVLACAHSEYEKMEAEGMLMSNIKSRYEPHGNSASSLDDKAQK